VHEIGRADLRARIVPALPLRNRSRLVQIIDALLYENAQECAVRLFPRDQLSRGVRAVMPSPYRSQ